MRMCLLARLVRMFVSGAGGVGIRFFFRVQCEGTTCACCCNKLACFPTGAEMTRFIGGADLVYVFVLLTVGFGIQAGNTGN